MGILIYIFSLASLLVLDGIWLNFVAKQFYQKYLGYLMAPSVNFIPAAIFYFIYALAISVLVVNPAIKSGAGLFQIFSFGVLLGLAAYGAYDLTNHTIVRDWPLAVTVVDMAWGAFVTGAASAIAYLSYQFFIF